MDYNSIVDNYGPQAIRLNKEESTYMLSIPEKFAIEADNLGSCQLAQACVLMFINPPVNEKEEGLVIAARAIILGKILKINKLEAQLLAMQARLQAYQN